MGDIYDEEKIGSLLEDFLEIKYKGPGCEEKPLTNLVSTDAELELKNIFESNGEHLIRSLRNIDKIYQKIVEKTEEELKYIHKEEMEGYKIEIENLKDTIKKDKEENMKFVKNIKSFMEKYTPK